MSLPAATAPQEAVCSTLFVLFKGLFFDRSKSQHGWYNALI